MAEEKQNPSTPPATSFSAHLVKEAETLTRFQGRLEKVLADLEDTHASKRFLGEQTVPAGSYGKDFTSATEVAEAYQKAHGNIVKLCQAFSDNIEMLGFAALISERGYDGLDAEQRREMEAIQRRIEQGYRGAKSGAEPSDDRSSAPAVDPGTAT